MRRPSAALLVGAALAVAALASVPTSAGAAGTYTVAQCHSQNRGHEAALSDDNAYSATNRCVQSSGEFSVQLNNTQPAGNGRNARALWRVPSAALGIVRVEVQGKLRRDNNHRSRLYMTDASGNEVARVATGGTEPTGFSSYAWSGSRQDGFAGILVCQSASGCGQSNNAKTWVRYVKFTVGDYSDPTFSDFSGSLLASGWLRGVRDLRATTTDNGSGLYQLTAKADGASFGAVHGSCPYVVAGTSTIAERFVPCGLSAALNLAAVNTAAAPFHDGANALSVCALDFARNSTCQTRTVMIDNTAPSLAFANSQDPNNPELIRASVSDPHSGVHAAQLYMRPRGGVSWQPLDTTRVGGELRSRVDSASLPEGEYEFRAEASDVAGNVGQTTLRQNGQPMILRFPLREEVTLRANLEPSGAKRQTIAYGKDSFVAGRLQTAGGSPLGGKALTIVERFADGTLVPERATQVRTDAKGRFEAKLGRGPSRGVLARFAGTRQHLAQTAAAGQLRVRSKISFRTSRKRVGEGQKVAFKGRLKRFGAKLPPGGKLIELQVQERAGRWQTVREALHTKPSGRYRLGYRFGTFYQADALFKFRAKVVREQGWPYKAPARSPSRKVILKAR